jgi:hypothetical protein
MDRQDIDALLIGALYGELTPADEARLAAHLDSHPTDRGALDDLKSARQAVRESRIFDLQLDPPQAVSALLLQEAHRRAPKRVVARDDGEKESWFFRFTRVFLAHPAMAAAAMLVLVIGFASVLYVRKGDQFADKQLAQPEVGGEMAVKAESAITTPTNEAPAAAADPAQLAEGAAVAGSGYSVRLDDKAAADTAERDRDVGLAKLQQAERAEQKNKKSTAIVVDTPRPQPKELPERAKAAPKKGAAASDDLGGMDGAFESTVVGGTGTSSTSPSSGAAPGGRVATSPTTTSKQEPAPPPPAAAPATVAQGTAKPTAPAPSRATVTKEAEKSEKPADAAPAKDSTLIAWAKGQHSSAVALAGKGNCAGAAKLAVAIQNRAPDYYTQFMATDRALKKCQQYIAAERDAEAERSGKARSQKKTNADEPSSTR